MLDKIDTGEDFGLIFTYLSSVDHKGHTYGWCGKEYLDQWQVVD